MKLLTILFAFVILTSCKKQKDEQKGLKGNWWYCDPSQGGYSEISISDSLIRYLSHDLYGFFPSTIKEMTNQKIVTNNGLEISLIDNDLALCKGALKIDTLKRVKEPVKQLTDYNCNMNISRYEYEQILLNEFLNRSIKSKSKCSPVVLDRINDKPASIVTLDSAFLNNRNSLLDELEITYDYRPKKKFTRDFNTSTASVKFNTDSSRALVQFTANGLCHDAYIIDALLKTDGELIINTQNFYSGCSDSCSFDYYLLLESLPGLEIKNLRLNNEIITIANNS